MPGSWLAGSSLHGTAGLSRGQPAAPVHRAGRLRGWLCVGRPAVLRTQELWGGSTRAVRSPAKSEPMLFSLLELLLWDLHCLCCSVSVWGLLPTRAVRVCVTPVAWADDV